MTLQADAAGAAGASPDTVRGDASFDLYARLVRRVLSVPTGLVTIVEPDRQVFPGAVGLPQPWQTTRETPLTHSFCQYVVRYAAPLVVTDARLDDRVAENLAIRDLHVVGYAGWPLTDHTGAIIGSLCAIDSQPREWSDAELADLADLAAACSAELAQRGLAAELELNVEELRRSNTQLAVFAAQISHDLRNPLSALSSSLQMIDEGHDTGRMDATIVDRLVKRARSSVLRMSDLVTSVLAFAVVDGQLSVEDVDVSALVATVREDLAVAISDTELTVGELAPVRADPEQLRVLVQNLVSNAVKHGAGSPVSVTTAQSGGAWTLSVADHGPGIDPADRDIVLQPFVRLDTRVQGSGLGLATCARIAEVHGGSLDIEETPGGGTTVVLRLPARR